MKPRRSFGAPKRTRAQRETAAFMLATLTDETPIADVARRHEALVGGRKRCDKL